jgi:hypothetical protein
MMASTPDELITGFPHSSLPKVTGEPTCEEYFDIAVDVFPVPNNPGPSAAVVASMMPGVIAETTRLHREATQGYHTYHNIDQAIKMLIIESFDNNRCSVTFTQDQVVV